MKKTRNRKYLWRLLFAISCLVSILAIIPVYASDPLPFRWVKQAGGVGYDSAIDIATDSMGNSYIIGICSANANFGEMALPNRSNQFYVAKYDPSGEIVWVNGFFSQDGSVHPKAITIDHHNRCTIVGLMSGALYGNNVSLGSSRFGVFAITLDGQIGRCNRWQRVVCEGSTISVSSIITDQEDNVIITGGFSGWARIGDNSLTSSGGQDIYIVKLNATNGSVLRAKKFGWQNDEICQGLAVDSWGNILMTGLYYGIANFSTTSLPNSGSADCFIAKFNNQCELNWAQHLGGDGYDCGYGITTNIAGNVFVTGSFQNTVLIGSESQRSMGLDDIFIAKYDANGTLLKSSSYGGMEADKGLKIVAQPAGHIVVAGSFRKTVGFGQNATASIGGNDIFIALFSSSLNHIWSQQIGGIEDDVLGGIALDKNLYCIITGFFRKFSIFAPISLNSVTDNNPDIFIAKIPVSTYPPPNFIYTARLVCGTQKDPGDMRLAEGNYSTCISIYNPNTFNVTVSKQIVLTYPPGKQIPVDPTKSIFDLLGKNQALQTDCMDIKERFYRDGLPNSYIVGFVIIKSDATLDVSALYTTTSLNVNDRVNSSFNIERVIGKHDTDYGWFVSEASAPVYFTTYPYLY